MRAPNPSLLSFAAIALALAITPVDARSRKQDADRGFRYVDAAKNMIVLADGGRSEQTSAGTYDLTLKGLVSIDSLSQGLHLTSDKVLCQTAKAASNRMDVKHAVATGKVHIVKTVTNKGAKELTDITCSKGDLQVATAGDIVALAGPVALRSENPAKRRTLTATGSSGTAVLEPQAKTQAKDGIRTAHLAGPVKLTLVQPAQKDAADGKPPGEARVVATSDEMDISNTGTQRTIILRGHVKIEGEGSSQMGSFSGRQATVILNAAGEVIAVNTGDNN